MASPHKPPHNLSLTKSLFLNPQGKHKEGQHLTASKNVAHVVPEAFRLRININRSWKNVASEARLRQATKRYQKI